MRSFRFPLLVLFAISYQNLVAQGQWISKRLTSTDMLMDPTEVQVSGSITALTDYSISERQYLPFSIGFDQAIYSKQLEDEKSWEFLCEFGAFTQFEWKIVNGVQQRNLMNIDYKIAFSFVKKLSQQSTYRVRFFHVSSHLGDDYIFRNAIIDHTTNKVNYEQLEGTYFHSFAENKTIYVGFGSVVRPNSLRKPFSAHLGGQFEFRQPKKSWAPSIAMNLKTFQETNFDPNLKLGIGMAYFRSKRNEPFRLMAEFYTGHLPYSQLEASKISWYGIGIYFKV